MKINKKFYVIGIFLLLVSLGFTAAQSYYRTRGDFSQYFFTYNSETHSNFDLIKNRMAEQLTNEILRLFDSSEDSITTDIEIVISDSTPENSFIYNLIQNIQNSENAIVTYPESASSEEIRIANSFATAFNLPVNVYSEEIIENKDMIIFIGLEENKIEILEEVSAGFSDSIIYLINKNDKNYVPILGYNIFYLEEAVNFMINLKQEISLNTGIINCDFYEFDANEDLIIDSNEVLLSIERYYNRKVESFCVLFDAIADWEEN